LTEPHENVPVDTGNDVTVPAPKRRKLSPQEDTLNLNPPTLDSWLPPTLAEEFRNHSPTTMFSEGQSTVPDNTLQLQQIAQQLSQYESPRPTENKSSIPWNELMNFESEVPAGSPPFEIIEEPPSAVESEAREQTPSISVPEQTEEHEESYTPPGTPVIPKSEPVVKRSKKLSKKSLRKSSRKRKTSLPESDDELSMVEAPTDRQEMKPIEVEVVQALNDNENVSPDFLPTSKVTVFVPRASSAVDNHITEDTAEELVPPSKEIEKPEPEKEGPTPKPRKRGRPKKVQRKTDTILAEELAPELSEDALPIYHETPHLDNEAAGPNNIEEEPAKHSPVPESLAESKENFPPMETKSTKVEKPLAKEPLVGTGKLRC